MLRKDRGRVAPPLKYLLIAAGVAVASLAVLEAMGSLLTSNYKGLGGKLEPNPGVAPATAPIE